MNIYLIIKRARRNQYWWCNEQESRPFFAGCCLAFSISVYGVGRIFQCEEVVNSQRVDQIVLEHHNR